MKKPKPDRYGIAFVARNHDGKAWLVTRPESGLLGGMQAFPSAGWTPVDAEMNPAQPLAAAPFAADWRLLDDNVIHVFTHFRLTMRVAVADMDAADMDVAAMAHLRDGDAAATWQGVKPANLPTLMRKVWKLAEESRRISG